MREVSSVAQVECGVVSETEAEACIGIEFNPVRAGFAGGRDVWTRDVLNLGVRPDRIIATVRAETKADGLSF
jgi:lycopene cyclase CruP